MEWEVVTLEGLEVLHPLEREVVRLDVCFVEEEDEGEFGFVEDAGEGLGGGKEGRDTTTRRDGGGMGPRKEAEGEGKGGC